MSQADLAHRVAVLEEVSKIKELRQCRFPAAGFPEINVEAVLDLFAEDGGFEYLNLSKTKGHKEIRHFFTDGPINGRFLLMVPAYVHVNDDLRTGHGRWHLLETLRMPSVKTGRNEPVWCQCAYEDEYIKVGEEWRFQHYTCEIRMFVTHQEGWGEKMVDYEQFFVDWRAHLAR